MTAGRKGTGIEIRGDAIRMNLRYLGVVCRETLYAKATAPNIRWAERLVDKIKREIEAGTFDYAAHFPNSKIAKAQLQENKKASTFKERCDIWLETKGRLTAPTLYQYKNALVFWQEKFGADVPIDEITHGKVAAVVGSHPWPSAKLCNNYLIPLRGVFKLAARDNKIMSDPVDGIENAAHQKPAPDPLSVSEMYSIIDWIRNKNPQVGNYFEFAFFTGMRPEELIELRWGDIDYAHGTIRVQRAKTFKGTVKPVKTFAMRDVDLVEGALEVLRRQKEYTFMKREEGSDSYPIFENPITGAPWHDERSQRDHYWQPALKSLGIRMRRAYQARHTYATTALMSGVNPAYIARQMGHSSAKMLFEVYSKWIDMADRGREKAKMEANLRSHFDYATANLPQICPISATDASKSLNNKDNIGRHDWTRTNDPYHVKVVL